MKQLVIILLSLICNSILFAQENKEVTDGGTQLFFGGGIANNSVSISGSTSSLEMNIDHPNNVVPAFVIGSKFTIKNTNNSLIIMPAIRIYSINSTAKKDLTSGTATYHHTSTFKAQPVISPTASIGYNIIHKPGFKWYVAGGFGFAFLVNGQEAQSNYYDPSDTELVADRKPAPMIFAFNAQTGFDIAKRIGVWAYYHPPTNTSNKMEKKVQVSTLHAGLCYYLNVN